MKILLLGEYSNLHNSLKQALINMGHEVLLVCNADGFKKYETDILIKSHLEDYLLFKLIARLFVRIFKINIFEIEIYLRAKKIVNNYSKFDLNIQLQSKKNTLIKNIKIPLIGLHNIRNATAAIAVSWIIGISKDTIKKGLNEFKGVHRRFNKIFE